AEPIKEEGPQFAKGDSVWWFDETYKGAGIVQEVNAEEKYYNYLIDFSKDKNSPATLWLVQEHLRRAEKPLYKKDAVVKWTNHKGIVLSSEPNPQGIFSYTLMQVAPKASIITLLEKELTHSSTQLITTQGNLKTGNIVWRQDGDQRRGGEIIQAYTLDGTTIYALKHIQEQFSDTTPPTIYVQEKDLNTPLFKTGTLVTWKLTAKNLQEEKELTGTGVIGPKAPTWVEGYLYKIIIQHAGDTEPPFLVPEENIETANINSK
ncbi:MAG: hypothetical protein Q7K43_01425, partial [Candidatus Woesearchaeota archaeon]|nr:hypothetical protein [Candidatus Woesearchaeota archaeon]